MVYIFIMFLLFVVFVNYFRIAYVWCNSVVNRLELPQIRRYIKCVIIIIIIIFFFCLSPPDVLDRCYFGVLFRSDPLRGSRNFRGTCAGYDILSRPIVLKCFLKSLCIAPNDPITSSTTVACFSHSLSISIFRSWYLLIFSVLSLLFCRLLGLPRQLSILGII